MLAERGAGKTICPSEAARRMAVLSGSPERWRAWMNRTRAVAIRMATVGTLKILQRGERVDPSAVSGPVRLGLP